MLYGPNPRRIQHGINRTLPTSSIKLQSKSLKAVKYDPETALLEVEFHSGEVYRYLTPAGTYRELLQAESKGRYFNQHIRNRFPTAKSDTRNAVNGSSPPDE